MADHIFGRVELHQRADGTKPDYEVLKVNLARWKFSHELWNGTTWELLPTGLYVRTEPASLDHALDFVRLAADMTGFDNEGVVYSSEGFRTFGLKVRPPKRVGSFLRAARLAPRTESSVPPLAPEALRNALRKRRHP